MASLGVTPDGSVLYVGDSNVDADTAHNAGLPCCGVLWGFRTREELTAAGAEYLAEDAAALEKGNFGVRVPGRDESLPYGLTVDGSLTEGSGGVKTPPYDVTYRGTKRNRELTQGCG